MHVQNMADFNQFCFLGRKMLRLRTELEEIIFFKHVMESADDSIIKCDGHIIKGLLYSPLKGLVVCLKLRLARFLAPFLEQIDISFLGKLFLHLQFYYNQIDFLYAYNRSVSYLKGITLIDTIAI
jgi:hypothetical protein